MTTITVEIDKDKDVSAVKEFIGRLGLKYQINADKGLEYTNEIKSVLDARYADYLEGKVDLVGAKESQKRIQELLTDKNK
jgi:hypothetical protein